MVNVLHKICCYRYDVLSIKFFQNCTFAVKCCFGCDCICYRQYIQNQENHSLCCLTVEMILTGDQQARYTSTTVTDILISLASPGD